MNSKKKLLSITNLKKYFPIAKTSIFQKEEYFVKANEDISIDIYEGETIGLVGESGCGKSTFGRTLLQLYPQTAGTTMYYGKDIHDVAPEYVKDTLKNFDKHYKEYARLLKEFENLQEQVDKAGGLDKADFFLAQNYNLAEANLQTSFSKTVKIVGGFFVEDAKADRKEAFGLMLKKLLNDKKIADYKSDINDCKTKIDVLDSEHKNVAKLNKKIDSNNTNIEKLSKTNEEIETNLAAIRNKYKDNEKFNEYEKLSDNGIDLSRLNYSEMRKLRNDLQIIFQDPYSSLNPRMTVGQIIEEGLITHNYYKPGSEAMKEYVFQTMEKCGLQDYMVYRYPHQFSGGQRQRICIARALAVKPKFVVCDECVSALDVSIQSQIINLLEELKEKDKLTYLFISHDLSVVKYISDKIGVMYLGNLVEFADKETLFKDPRHPYTVALLSSIPTTDLDSRDKDKIILEGNIPSPIKPPEGCKFHTRCFMACDKCKHVTPKLTEIEPGHFVACHFAEKKLDENGNYLFEYKKKTN